MGRLIVPASGSVYLDANCVIYTVEKIQPYAALLDPIWQAAASVRIRVLSSELTLLETLVGPMKESNARLEAILRAFLLNSSELRLVPIDTTVLMRAAHIRATSNLKTPDAIHAATALETHAFFVTNDPAFRRVNNLPIAILRDLA